MSTNSQLDSDVLEFVVELFDAILISILVLLGLTCTTAKLSSRISRSKTWFLFIGSTMFWCGAYLLLLGRQGNQEPPFGICILQSALGYAANPFTTISALGLVLELHMKLNILSISDRRMKQWRSWLLAIPPAVAIAVFFYVIGVGVAHPEAVQRDASRIFCHITPIDGFGAGQPYIISTITTILPDTFVLIFSILVAIKVCITKRRLGRAIPSTNTSVTVSLVIRVTALTVLLSIGNVMGITSLIMDPNSSAVGWNLALTLMPVSVFLLFGTQKDLLYAWCCRNKVKRGDSTKLSKDIEMANVRPSPSRVDLLQTHSSEER
ncbi:hypothetical protein EDD18DRAFT_690070 [Armillaria luteobubalina]|uniref:Uncharacterized protein n=1 Tax=Armillaria luteobubalina TaxID=153913 RepID=A0AA39QG97_9AGAR|nr:hypothetical protein EDD18DRAFT_690070 [Armillaria luteobubalina]